ncbi:MAG TPA: hypothetical protein VHY32_11325 [Caulobacteraceae bacterium]|nr:hypothetical protein [Caulobacteraceae bacterium]
MGALLGASAAAAADKDAADVAPLLQEKGIPCTVTGTRTVVKGANMSDGSTASIYEVACQEGLGQILISRNKEPKVQVEDCLTASQPGPDGKPSKMACKLPANADPKSAFGPVLTKLGRDCTVDNARGIGSTPTQAVYEVACKAGPGYIVMLPHAPGAEMSANPCIGYDEIDNAATKCTLSTPEQRAAVINQLVAQGGKPCTVKAHHFIGTTTEHSDYLEVACTEGKGYVLETDNAGKFKSEMDCAQASGIAGGCTLTDTRAAQTEQSGVYSRLAKKAGFDCDVAKYAAFAVNDPSTEVVELQCSNRPDGGVGIFPASGNARVLDCVRSQVEGYHCTYSNESAVYPALYAQLKAKGKSSCVVNGARGVGKTKEGEEFVEVACADGGPGWVLDYPPNAAEPGSLMNCAQAVSVGGCQLPTNKQH